MSMLPSSDVLVVNATDDFLSTDDGYVDPVWEAVRTELGVKGQPIAYTQGAQFLPELRAHTLYLEDRDRFFRLFPRLRSSGGVPATGIFQSVTLGTRSVCLFSCDLRLCTDGPSTPALRLMPQIVDEVKPKLIIHVGLGCGTRPDHQAGDVIVTHRARLFLRGELEGLQVNGSTYGGGWTPDPSNFAGLTFPPLQEPALVAPSPNYENKSSQPDGHIPVLRIEALPVLSRPMVTDLAFDLASPDQGDHLYYWADQGCAVDMDAAVTTAAAASKRPCAVVIGVSTPAVRRMPNDFESTLRRAWAATFIDTFAAAAAQNVAQVVRRIIEKL